MATFVNQKDRAFSSWNDAPSLPLDCKSLFHMKTYPSAIDVRAWTHNALDRKKYIIDLFSADTPLVLKIGKFVPVATVLSVLSKLKDNTIEELQDKIKYHETLLENLELTPRQREIITGVKSIGPEGITSSSEIKEEQKKKLGSSTVTLSSFEPYPNSALCDSKCCAKNLKEENKTLKNQLKSKNLQTESNNKKLELQMVNNISIICENNSPSDSEILRRQVAQLQAITEDRDRYRSMYNGLQRKLVSNAQAKCDSSCTASCNDTRDMGEKLRKNRELDVLRNRLKEMDRIKLERDHLKLRLEEMCIKEIELKKANVKQHTMQMQQTDYIENSMMMLDKLNHECDRLRQEAVRSKNLGEETKRLENKCKCYEESIYNQEEQIKHLTETKKSQISSLENLVCQYKNELSKKIDVIKDSQMVIANLQNELQSSKQLNKHMDDLKIALRQAQARILQLTRQLEDMHGEFDYYKQQVELAATCCNTPDQEKDKLVDIQRDNESLKNICERLTRVINKQNTVPTNAEIYKSKAMQTKYREMCRRAKEQTQWVREELARCKEQGTKCLKTKISNNDSMYCNCSSNC